MWRTLALALAGLLICGSGLLAQQNKKDEGNKEGTLATIVKASGEKITLKAKDTNGKEVEQTYDVKKDNVTLLNANGKEGRLDNLKAGDQVRVKKVGNKIELHRAK